MTLLNSVAFSYPLLIIITFGKMKKIFFFFLLENAFLSKILSLEIFKQRGTKHKSLFKSFLSQHLKKHFIHKAYTLFQRSHLIHYGVV